MNRTLKTLLTWLALGLVFGLCFHLLEAKPPSRYETFKTFLHHVDEEQVAIVRVTNQKLLVTLTDDGEYYTVGALDEKLMEKLADQGVSIAWGEKKNTGLDLLVSWFPLLVFLAVFLFFLKRMGGGTANYMSLSKSKARVVADKEHLTFADVGGCTEAKELFADVVDFLKNPKRWKEAGVRLPRGILLEGPPGCGKTLMARAVAGETNAKFYAVSASEFVEMFVGVGAARVRDTFETATKNAPAVIFIDELDAVGRKRSATPWPGHEEREQTLNQLLVCLDGFSGNGQVVVIGATNRPDILDKALLRPGRFDRIIKIPALRHADRCEILKIHTRNKKLHADINLEEWADRTEGWNGAELEHLVNEAALRAVRNLRDQNGTSPVVSNDDFLRAFEPTREKKALFSKLDSVLIESSSQLAEPTGQAVARLTLRNTTVIEGKVMWVDGSFIKIQNIADGAETLIPKGQIQTIVPLAGTEDTSRQDIIVDRWTTPRSGVA